MIIIRLLNDSGKVGEPRVTYNYVAKSAALKDKSKFEIRTLLMDGCGKIIDEMLNVP